MNTLGIVVFVVLPFLGLAAAVRVWMFLRNGVRVTARIMGYKTVRLRTKDSVSSDIEDQYLPMVAFHDENGIYRELTLPTERPVKVRGVRDDEIRIVYPKGDPKKAKVDDWATLWILPLVLLTPAVLLAVALVWLYVIAFMERANAHR